MPRYWVSFDLGLRANHEELYAWLDSLGARECGESVATFVSSKSREQIMRELGKVVGPGVRVYLIGKQGGGKFRGEFIVGKRRAAPWAGYAPRELESKDEA